MIGLLVALAATGVATGYAAHDARLRSRLDLPFSVWSPVSLVEGMAAYILILVAVSLPVMGTRAARVLTVVTLVYAVVGTAVAVKGSYRNGGLEIWYLSSSLVTVAGFTGLLLSRLPASRTDRERYMPWFRRLILVLLAACLIFGLRAVDRGGGFWGFSSAVFSRLWLALLLCAWAGVSTRTPFFVLAAGALVLAAVGLSVHRGLNVDSRDIFFFQLIGYSARALVVLAAAGLIDSVRATAAVVTLILGACANAASLLGLVDPGFGFWPRFWDFAELLFQPWCLATTAGVLVWVGSHPQDNPTAHGETQPA